MSTTGSDLRDDLLRTGCKQSTINTQNPRSVIADIYDSPPGTQVHYFSLRSACICLSLWAHIPCGGKNAFRRAALGSMAAAGYRLGFKGPFAPLKEAAAAFGSPLCPPRRHPHIHPHSTSPLKTHSHTLFTPPWIHRAWRPPARAGKRKLLVFVIVLVY